MSRIEVTRKPERARYDRATIDAILDEARSCTVAFVRDGGPVAIPTIHARVGDTLYLHGSTGSGMLASIAGKEICVSVTLLDGLVLARSAFHHSMNYRSVVVFGGARDVTDEAEKLTAMRAVVEHVLPGRWEEARQPTSKEIAATRIVGIPLDEVSAKVRTGPPLDDEEDATLPIWAGVIGLRTVAELPDGALPPSVRRLSAP